MEQKKSNRQNLLSKDMDTIDVAIEDRTYVILPSRITIIQNCVECCMSSRPKYIVTNNYTIYYICDDKCLSIFKKKYLKEIAFVLTPTLKVKNLMETENFKNRVANFRWERKCGECAKEISDLAINLSWDIMEFCNEQCLENCQKRIGPVCIFCRADIIDLACLGKYTLRCGCNIRQFCGKSCVDDYKNMLKICGYCLKDISDADNRVSTYVNDKDGFVDFCTIDCTTKYRLHRSQDVPNQPKTVCALCHNSENITIKFGNETETKMFCEKSCFMLFTFVNDIVAGTCDSCQKYFNVTTLKSNSIYYKDTYHVFCSASCKNMHIVASKKIVPCNQCRIKKYCFDMIRRKNGDIELIMCSLTCLRLYQQVSDGTASSSRKYSCGYCKKNLELVNNTEVDTSMAIFCSYNCYFASQDQTSTSAEFQRDCSEMSTAEFKETTFVMAAASQRNVATMCKTTSYDKSVDCKPATADKAIQTDELQKNIIILPIPVPISIPLPVCQYSLPTPVFFPFPLPIPVPIFIPTTSRTTTEIMTAIQNIKEKTPADPLEAELLTMAKMVACDSQPQGSPLKEIEEDLPQNEVEKSSSKVLFEELEDLENILSPSTTNILRSSREETKESTEEIQSPTSGKRSGDSPEGTKNKKQKADAEQIVPQLAQNKSDDQMSLKYMLVINIWNHWILLKNSEFPHQAKLFKTELLQLTVEELNYALCLFIKEVRKPNGLEYIPDITYYMCLCIQTYLLKNGRTDNIFYDSPYQEFAECLDEVAKKFQWLHKNEDHIITHVREEHLWESNQLGAYNPNVLLNTIMYFNTKYFNLKTINEHMKLTFLKVMRNCTRKFKQSAVVQKAVNNTDMNTRNLQINIENQINAVKLYQFYLSKCPESLKTCNEVFYLIPERHCTLDSPVWFSTTPLSQDHLERMFHRIKFVEEINTVLYRT